MTPAGFEDIIKDAWETLEGHGFPPEACSYLPAAIDNAITALTGARDDLLAEVIQLRAQVEEWKAKHEDRSKLNHRRAEIIENLRTILSDHKSAEWQVLSAARAALTSTMREADQ